MDMTRTILDKVLRISEAYELDERAYKSANSFLRIYLRDLYKLIDGKGYWGKSLEDFDRWISGINDEINSVEYVSYEVKLERMKDCFIDVAFEALDEYAFRFYNGQVPQIGARSRDLSDTLELKANFYDAFLIPIKQGKRDLVFKLDRDKLKKAVNEK